MLRHDSVLGKIEEQMKEKKTRRRPIDHLMT